MSESISLLALTEEEIQNLPPKEIVDIVKNDDDGINALRIQLFQLISAFSGPDIAWKIADKLVEKTAEERYQELRKIIPEAFIVVRL